MKAVLHLKYRKESRNACAFESVSLLNGLCFMFQPVEFRGDFFASLVLLDAIDEK